MIATSILSSMDAHQMGLYYPVENIEAQEAVAKYGQDCDVLLMCWPTVTNAALFCAQDWGNKPIVFIGEVTDYSLNHLGGCATDEFHERFVLDHQISYQGNMLEQTRIGRLKPFDLSMKSHNDSVKKKLS